MKTRSAMSLLAVALVAMTSISARANDEPTAKDKAADVVQKQAVKQMAKKAAGAVAKRAAGPVGVVVDVVWPTECCQGADRPPIPTPAETGTGAGTTGDKKAMSPRY